MLEHTPLYRKGTGMATYADVSRERLIGQISSEIKDLFEKFLDYLELITDDTDKLRKVRSKVLRNGNNSIRRLTSIIESNYVVAYDPSLGSEDIIEIQPVTFKREVSGNGKETV